MIAKRLDPWTTLPVLLCIALYWPGLTAWFQRDDFAWLNLGWEAGRFVPLRDALFAPKTEGTVRVLSERAFFIALYKLFGLNATPFRLVVFATQAANLVLLVSIARRLTASRAAAVLAACLWVANTALATPLSWTSAYNQVLCAFFVLSGFRLLIAYLDTGRRRYYAGQWIVLLLGFGTSEFMVVYPAAAILFVLVRHQRLPVSIALLCLPSLAFAAQHLLVMKAPASGPYAFVLDWRILPTFATYWRWTLGPGQMENMGYMRAEVAGWLSLLMTMPLMLSVGWQARRREYLPAYFLVWYVLWLVPILPLPYHITDYYPAIGSIGIAIAGGWAVANGWRSGWPAAAAATALLGLYGWVSGMPARITSQWFHDQSSAARRLVEGVSRTQKAYPGRTVLVSGVDRALFWAAVCDNPWRVLAKTPVYLTPETPDWIRERPELGDVLARYELPEQAATDLLASGQAVIYDAPTGTLAARPPWKLATGPPASLQLGSDACASWLGPGWYAGEGTHRWMARRAVLTLPRVPGPGANLHLEGYATRGVLAEGPLLLTARAGAAPLGTRIINRPESHFTLQFGLPRELAGTGSMMVTLEVNRTFRPPGETRELGIALSRVLVR